MRNSCHDLKVKGFKCRTQKQVVVNKKKTEPFIEVDIRVPNYSNLGNMCMQRKNTVRMKGKTGLYMHIKVIWGRWKKRHG